MKKIKLFSIVVFLIAGLSLQAAKEKFTSTFNKEFDVNRNATVEIDNSFGDIQCYTWNENSVKIEVMVEVYAADKRSANRVFDRIDIEISGDKNRVTEKTEVNNIKGRNVKFKISVSVHLPESLNLEFTNKFGNTYVGTVSGKTMFDQSFGILQVTELLNDDNEINVQHGALHIELIKEADIEIQHSELSIEKAGFLQLDAQFTDAEIEEIDKLYLDANFGSIKIDEVDIVESTLNGTTLKIDYLKNSFQADCNLGEIEIDEVGRNFTEIDIDGQHASISIGVDNESNFSFDLSARFASIYIPSSFNATKEKLSFNSYRYRGKVGSRDSQSLITIDSNFGTIEIK